MKQLLLCAIVALLTLASSADAQTNITVLGTGYLAFDIDLAPAEAMQQVYKLYIPANTTGVGTPATVQCTGTTATALCMMPLSVLNLQVGAAPITLAVTSSKTAGDGVLESERVVAPFALSKTGPPVAPRWSATPIRPASQ